jgi:CBS domain-containing protein
MVTHHQATPVPAPSLVAALRAELMRFPPFQQMATDMVDRFVLAAEQLYYAPGELVLSPDGGAVTHLLLLRRGSVTGRHGAASAAEPFLHEAGDMFPVGALLGARPVAATYTSEGDTFCLRVPATVVKQLAADSAPFADHLHRRVMHLLTLSQQALQASHASQLLAEQSLESPLSGFPAKAPAMVPGQTPLAEALRLMHARRIGSVLVGDNALADGGVGLQGILTRHDILDRITLPQVPLDTPIAQVMSAPVHALRVDATAQDAALLMSRHGIRHVPVVDGAGRVVNVVSERDLFALQRMSIKQVGVALRSASGPDAMRAAAQDIRRLASGLMGQGVRARELTELISHLNDVLTQRVVAWTAEQHGVDLSSACWLAFGSEGRSEQTIATDQDNGLVFESDDPERDRGAWLAFAQDCNQLLDDCGYPLCKGQIMASNPACCMTAQEWMACFDRWIEHGSPSDLLKASIFFDFRHLAGQTEREAQMRAHVTRQAASVPRFLKQLADNALRNLAPLNWRGAIDTQSLAGREMVDLKLHGTALFVDFARLYALAFGLAAINTRARLQGVGQALSVPTQESEAWVAAFEFLQWLRLRVQLQRQTEADGDPDDNPNRIDVSALNDIDRRMLKESLRVARRLQQRMALDYQR